MYIKFFFCKHILYSQFSSHRVEEIDIFFYHDYRILEVNRIIDKMMQKKD